MSDKIVELKSLTFAVEDIDFIIRALLVLEGDFRIRAKNLENNGEPRLAKDLRDDIARAEDLRRAIQVACNRGLEV